MPDSVTDRRFLLAFGESRRTIRSVCGDRDAAWGVGSGSPFMGCVESMKIDLQGAMVRAMIDPMERQEIIRVQTDLNS